jgi:hypothetical protein
MSNRDKVVALAAASGILLVIAALSHHWFTAPWGRGYAELGLRDVHLCTESLGCGAASYDAAGRMRALGQFRSLGGLAWLWSLAAGVLLLAHAYLVGSRDHARLQVPAAAAALVAGMVCVAAVLAMPRGRAGVELGWSLWLALAGAMTGGASAIPRVVPTQPLMRARDWLVGVRDGLHRAALGRVGELTDPAPPVPLPRARVSRRATTPPLVADAVARDDER